MSLMEGGNRFIATQEKVLLGFKEGYPVLQAGAITLNVW
jgi:hypothetical protein